MNALITGGTGFIGQKLTIALLQQGYHVYILTRNPKIYDPHDAITYIGYDHPLEGLPAFQTIINLAGDSLFGYWTKKKKATIEKSRIEITEFLYQYIKNIKTNPEVFINGSAIGYYGTSLENIFTENTTQHGDDFLAKVVVAWEKTAQQIEALGIRTVYLRFGVVLGKQGGAFPLMAMPVKFFVGGKIGHGEQWISWVHIKEAVQMILFCLSHDHIKGPVNVTAPHPIRNKDFMRTVAQVMKRPYWFPTPAWFMRGTIGEMSQLITEGQYVLPQKLEQANYPFLYPTLEDALEEIINS